MTPATPPSREPPRLWADIALALALVVLVTVVLNGGLAWLFVTEAQIEGRVAMAESTSASLAAAITELAGEEGGDAAVRRVLGSFRDPDLGLSELYVVQRSLAPIAVVRGEPPTSLEAGFREAFFGRRTHLGVENRFSRNAKVVVTRPLVRGGEVKAALRLSVPLYGTSLFENRVGFLLLYTLFTAGIITLAGFSLLRRRLVIPVQTLREGTARIADGDFGHRVHVEASAELHELTEALNHMAASLSRYRHRTQDQVQRLEQANEALARAQEDLIRSAKLASVGRLAAGIAHEIGNPLAALVGYLDLLAGGPASDGQQVELLRRSRREVDRIHAFIQELLSYARPGEGAIIDVEIAGVIEGAVSTVRHQPWFREVEIDVVVGSRLPPVRAELEKLHQVFVNLLLNAADAMKGAGRVEIRAEERDGSGRGGSGRGKSVRITLRDTGPGFGADALEQAFEPFYTTKPEGKGAGLGLATSLAIVERFGGTITARNPPGGGAELEVVLPGAEGGDAPE